MSEAQERQEAHLDTAGHPSPGQMLKRERERQGLNLDEVAVQLNLRPAVVSGLEADSYDQVPIAAYRRGYLRAYARLMGIDEVKVVDAYNAQHGRSDLERKLTPVHTTKPPSRVGAWIFKLVTLLVILGLIGLTLLWWQSRQGNDLLGLGAPGEPVAVESLDGEPVGEDAAPATGDDEAGTVLPPLPEEESEMGLVDDGTGLAADGGQPGADAIDDGTQAGPGESASVPTDMGDASATPPAELAAEIPSDTTDAATGGESAAADTEDAAVTEAAAPAPVTDERSLTLVFNEESWTEIYDGTDERILVGLQPPGSQVTVEGEPPFRLTIGNASGVELSYGGEPVDLDAYTGGNNVARFNLGE